MARGRSVDAWANAQRARGATEADIQPLFICQGGRVLEGWINLKHGTRILTMLRRATTADELRAGVKRLGRKLGLLQTGPALQ
jgi:hypothetical protein